MNADEIVRALKCCSRVDAQCNGCDGCPFEYCGPECDLLCKNAATLTESMQSQLADYHHMSELVDGKMEENQRLRRINENLQEQLAESQRREKAARNELCLKCGLYHDAHNGACDGCRWKEKTKC